MYLLLWVLYFKKKFQILFSSIILMTRKLMPSCYTKNKILSHIGNVFCADLHQENIQDQQSIQDLPGLSNLHLSVPTPFSCMLHELLHMSYSTHHQTAWKREEIENNGVMNRPFIGPDTSLGILVIKLHNKGWNIFHYCHIAPPGKNVLFHCYARNLQLFLLCEEILQILPSEGMRLCNCNLVYAANFLF